MTIRELAKLLNQYADYLDSTGVGDIEVRVPTVDEENTCQIDSNLISISIDHDYELDAYGMVPLKYEDRTIKATYLRIVGIHGWNKDFQTKPGDYDNI